MESIKKPTGIKVGVVGLGLIGGSLAKAYRAYSEENNAGIEIYADDANESIVRYAQLAGVIDGRLDKNSIPQCDLIMVALYPTLTVEYLKRIAGLIGKETLVIDMCGTKKLVCSCGFALAEQYGFTFVGGHPMAGTQYSGFKHSKSTMFHGAPMVIVPPRYDDIALFDRIKFMLIPAGFGKLSITDAEKHDKMIAFTSQLAHVVSNAYVKSPTAKDHDGFSAGSYKDLTRVAWLNEKMWTELFLENKENLVTEIDCIVEALLEYKQAMLDDDADKLCEILKQGRLAKEEIDG